jgi:hypothetical protein
MGNNLIKLLIIFGIFVLLLSCDLFLPAPLGRDNPEDDELQIYNFSSAVIGSDKITTVWDWRAPNPATDSSRIIEEIWIVHSVDNSTAGRPLDSSSEDVLVVTNTSNWEKEWVNLQSDKNHYFALYAKEAGGTWLAPVLTDQYLDNNTGYEETSTWPNVGKGTVMNGGVLQTISAGLNKDTWLVLRVDYDNLQDMEYIISTISSFENSFSAGMEIAGEVRIIAGFKSIELGYSWDFVSSPDTLDYNNALILDITTFPQSEEVSTIFNLAKFYGSNTIVIAPTETGGLVLHSDDIGLDSFSYWRRN